MLINIVTTFPEFYDSFLKTSLVQKSIKKKLIKFNIVDLKKFGVGKFPKIDDTQYGGGFGMVLRVDVIKKALDSISNKGEVLALTAKGKIYNQPQAIGFSTLNTLTILCGRYEGFDERVFKYVDHKVSLGEFITLGGESPSLCLVESIIRLIPGVIGNIKSTNKESYGKQYFTKHPVYTKPKVFDGMEVPNILTTGDHKKIEDWQNKNSVLTKL